MCSVFAKIQSDMHDFREKGRKQDLARRIEKRKEKE